MVFPLRDWTVDFGRGPQPIQVPHVWHLDAPLGWEGPASYRTTARVEADRPVLVFHGVSYEAVVRVNGAILETHRGIWDAFSVDLSDWVGQEVLIEVTVTKNGGATFPVPTVASGFLPYVYGTFGGIFREVEFVSREALARPKAEGRVEVDGRRIFVDGKPFYARGVLTWGWYPDLATPHLPSDRIAREIAQVKSLGFNLIKFCLWMPPHEYLRQMRIAGMMAWLELPLWLPAGDEASLAGFRTEVMRIVDQYAHHDNVLAWTIGCELSESTPASFREELVAYVRHATGSPLVKDNSGGAEMYGGDPREFGDFDDFHPYCDTHFYPQVLDSLAPGPRPERAILLGEFNDYDVCRDWGRVVRKEPYWASHDPALNEKGVRWQYDAPEIAARFAGDAGLRERLPKLIESSVSQSRFIRKFVQEQVRSRSFVSGSVVTGWADTPISTSGFLDDWGDLRHSPEDVKAWNGPDCLFLIPRRMPPWVNGGNRPGWRDLHCHWTTDVLFQIGVHSESGVQVDNLMLSVNGREMSFNQMVEKVGPLESTQILTAFCSEIAPGSAELRASFGGHSPIENSWPITLVEKQVAPWGVDIHDPIGAFAGLRSTGIGPTIGTDPMSSGLVFLLDEGTVPVPFWREACYEWNQSQTLDWAQRWHQLLAVAPDRAIDSDWLAQNLPGCEILLTRIDTRTHRELPVLARGTRHNKTTIITTLRPFGGLGSQPVGVDKSPSGTQLLRDLFALTV